MEGGKTITTAAGEVFQLDFFCQRRQAHMTYIGCERMMEAARKNENRIQARKSMAGWVPDPVDENPCLGCSQGKQIAERNHAHLPKIDGRCLWPNCDRVVQTSGLCEKHYRQLKRNALIRVNTNDAGSSAVQEFLEKLIQISDEVDMDLEDVALAALDEGVKIYFERKERQNASKQAVVAR